MKMNKLALVLGFAIASALFLEIVAHADEFDQSTTLTFHQPIQIPGQVLPAGKYQFKLADPNDMNLVRILSADGAHVYATLQTVATEQREPTGDTILVMAEPGNGPEALLKWFYPGRTTGNQFLYSNEEEQQLARDRQQTIQVNESAEAGD
jgi:hypothetical protein